MLYLVKPDGFKPSLPLGAVGCLVFWQGLILMLKRPPHGDYSNRWGFPSGKIDPGESPWEAMNRELWEETKIVSNGDLIYLGRAFIEYPNDFNFEYHMFRMDIFGEEEPIVKLNPEEHVDYDFVTIGTIMTAPDTMRDVDSCIREFYLK